MNDKEQLIKIIKTFFDIGKNKKLHLLYDIQLQDSIFSSFSDMRPKDLKDFSTTIALEELRFVNISDYDYQLQNIKISLLDNFAVAAFELYQHGLLVDDTVYSCKNVSSHIRVTFVFFKKPKWKIVHIHMSDF
ncbi:MAG: hypothetical protein OXF28_02925 [Thaumarchaeota archaeon]|nr:hypothetical protein [Nitrososphaerota archaeon]MCY3976070.1 hypothetical protein [Nitrososphaerota archaeon]